MPRKKASPSARSKKPASRPASAKKVASTKSALPPAYQPASYEQEIYAMWEKGEYFKGVTAPDKTPYCIIMPPPNATGELHVGHGLGETIQDILTRFERMRGKSTLLLPGTDHAAIASQTKVERILAEKEGKTRHDLGREEFLKRVQEFVENSKDHIRQATRRLGVSCDWSRERYTMDKEMTGAVYEAFVRLYNDGLIYRGKRIISWCPRCASGLSDIEVQYRDVPGSLWYIKYPIVEDGKWSLEKSIMVATTRPETMLGDTAIAVHPDDERYKHLIGKHVLLPIIEREIPVVADKHVDKTFGTGALKITPAHDMADYEIAQRHKLEAINVIGESGRMTKHAHDFADMEVEEAREAVVERLQTLGFLDHIEDARHNVPVCERCETKVQPLISSQWFVKIKPLADKAVAAVKSGEITFISKRFEKSFFQWMENIHDWNISRQLWWGHRIPVWNCEKCAHVLVAVEPSKACPKCQHTKFKQDPDTLDTWFSSGLWTFATLGWPDKNAPDLKYWHPTDVMETGRDILFFWVARMIMMTLYLQGEVPFKKVYMHGLVVDSHGQKMSKSKGNVIDLIGSGDKYGMDAVRLALVSNVTEGLESRLHERKIEAHRNFVNKLWNVGRFVMATTECKKSCAHLEELDLEKMELEDRWILHRLNETSAGMTDLLERYRFSDAAQTITQFLWSDFADWYVEIAKRRPGPVKNDILLLVLEEVLKLIHPFAPFISEVLWTQLKAKDDNPLIITSWPIAALQLENKKAAADFDTLRALIVGLRTLRADYRVPPSTIIKVVLPDNQLLNIHADLIAALARVEISKTTTLSGAMTRTINGHPVAAQLGEHINTKKEHTRITRELAQTEKVWKGISGRLKSKVFVTKAPAKVVAKEKERAVELEKKVADLKQRLEELSQLL
jgi:valyl-tRNA synthetase